VQILLIMINKQGRDMLSGNLSIIII